MTCEEVMIVLLMMGTGDPYEIQEQEWLEPWPTVTCIHIRMYLLFS